MAQLNLDLHTFFTRIRPMFGMLTQGQVNGIQAIVAAWEASPETDIRWLAYEMATAWWETGHAMQPVAEVGHGAGKAYGQIDQTGKAPYGRGLVQITWRTNYIKLDGVLGLHGTLAANYDMALDPTVAIKIMFAGMEQGLFTGKKLSDYINDKGCDYFHAREIINGLDQAQKIADAALTFEEALHAAITAFIPAVGPTPRPNLWVQFLQTVEEFLTKLKALT